MNLVSIALLGFLVLSLTACGGGDDTYTTTATETHSVDTITERISTVAPTTVTPPAPTASTPVVPVVPAPCAKPDPKPDHGRDPACH